MPVVAGFATSHAYTFRSPTPGMHGEMKLSVSQPDVAERFRRLIQDIGIPPE